eukprot:3050372-Prymnesium_polylepis.1
MTRSSHSKVPAQSCEPDDSPPDGSAATAAASDASASAASAVARRATMSRSSSRSSRCSRRLASSLARSEAAVLAIVRLSAQCAAAGNGHVADGRWWRPVAVSDATRALRCRLARDTCR